MAGLVSPFRGESQDTLVDAIENAEVAEIKRSIFRSLTRLRAAEIKELRLKDKPRLIRETGQQKQTHILFGFIFFGKRGMPSSR